MVTGLPVLKTTKGVDHNKFWCHKIERWKMEHLIKLRRNEVGVFGERKGSRIVSPMDSSMQELQQLPPRAPTAATRLSSMPTSSILLWRDLEIL